MILLYTFLEFVRGAWTSTIDNNTEVPGDVHMEITENVIVGQVGRFTLLSG
jgi:hypothetical protein